MGILDGIVDWLATQIMNLLDLITSSVLGALGCDMSTFKRYFPAAATMYEIFVWIGVGLLLLNLVWSLFKNYGTGLDVETEDPVKLLFRSGIFLLCIELYKGWLFGHLQDPAACPLSGLYEELPPSTPIKSPLFPNL